MFYSTTNQICTTTGIQDDSIKEHKHGYNDYHLHALDGELGSEQGNVTSSTQSGGGSRTLTFNITTGEGGKHKHEGTADSKGHTHTLSKQGKDAVTDAGHSWIAMTDYSGRTPINLTTKSSGLGSETGAHTHSLTINEGGIHTHNIYQTITLGSSGNMFNNTDNFGSTETRPKNRLFRIWRRIL